MWLVTVPAAAVAVTTVPALQVSGAHHWIKGVSRFLAMFGAATVCSPIMTVLMHVTAARGRRSDILLSCWWISAGAAVWLSVGWPAAIAGAAGAAVLLHLMVRQLATIKAQSTNRRTAAVAAVFVSCLPQRSAIRGVRGRVSPSDGYN